jgi:hypothetical protein
MMAPTNVPRCPCGEDHSSSPAWSAVLHFVSRQGETVPVEVTGGGEVWQVPRIWIAFHGVPARDLPELGTLHGWKRSGAASGGG